MASLEAAADWNDVAHTLVRRLIANLDGEPAAAEQPQAMEHSND